MSTKEKKYKCVVCNKPAVKLLYGESGIPIPVCSDKHGSDVFKKMSLEKERSSSPENHPYPEKLRVTRSYAIKVRDSPETKEIRSKCIPLDETFISKYREVKILPPEILHALEYVLAANLIIMLSDHINGISVRSYIKYDKDDVKHPYSFYNYFYIETREKKNGDLVKLQTKEDMITVTKAIDEYEAEIAVVTGKLLEEMLGNPIGFYIKNIPEPHYSMRMVFCRSKKLEYIEADKKTRKLALQQMKKLFVHCFDANNRPYYEKIESVKMACGQDGTTYQLCHEFKDCSDAVRWDFPDMSHSVCKRLEHEADENVSIFSCSVSGVREMYSHFSEIIKTKKAICSAFLQLVGQAAIARMNTLSDPLKVLLNVVEYVADMFDRADSDTTGMIPKYSLMKFDVDAASANTDFIVFDDNVIANADFKLLQHAFGMHNTTDKLLLLQLGAAVLGKPVCVKGPDSKIRYIVIPNKLKLKRMFTEIGYLYEINENNRKNIYELRCKTSQPILPPRSSGESAVPAPVTTPTTTTVAITGGETEKEKKIPSIVRPLPKSKKIDIPVVTTTEETREETSTLPSPPPSPPPPPPPPPSGSPSPPLPPSIATSTQKKLTLPTITMIDVGKMGEKEALESCRMIKDTSNLKKDVVVTPNDVAMTDCPECKGTLYKKMCSLEEGLPYYKNPMETIRQIKPKRQTKEAKSQEQQKSGMQQIEEVMKQRRRAIEAKNKKEEEEEEEGGGWDETQASRNTYVFLNEREMNETVERIIKKYML
jgi:hypothetical protein